MKDELAIRVHRALQRLDAIQRVAPINSPTFEWATAARKTALELSTILALGRDYEFDVSQYAEELKDPTEEKEENNWD